MANKTMSSKEMMETLLAWYFSKDLEKIYNIARRRGESSYTLPGTNMNTAGKSESFNIQSNIEEFTVEAMYCSGFADFVGDIMKDIEDGMDALEHQAVKILSWTYSNKDRLTDQEIAKNMGYVDRTIRRKRSQYIKKLMTRIQVEYYFARSREEFPGFYNALIGNIT